jgi:aryl-alcohol dehydrogenase-like predicted oxidoreductase
MHRIALGNQGFEISRLGLGCMGMSEFYGATDDSGSLATLERALDLGISFWDTADIYGPFTNEALLARVLATRRDEVELATKFGIVRDSAGGMALNSRPEYVRAACEASLRRLGVETIDLYYQHRVDPQVPIEETVGAMADLVRAGKVRYLGLSEANSEQIRRAHAEAPVTAVQTEYSLWSRELESDVLPALRELGIGLVAYSPLGRGFLTGTIVSRDDLAPDDWRLANPRFSATNLQQNLTLADKLREMAADKAIQPAQLALAWVLAQGNDVTAIPGTRRIPYLEQNVDAVQLALSDAELQQLDAWFPAGVASGSRY